MSYLKEADRKRLVNSIEDFITIIDDEQSQQDIFKTAEEIIKKYDLPPNLIRVFCNAINHGQFADQLEKCGNDTSCRLSNFNILIPDLLIEKLYQPEKSASECIADEVNNYWDRLIKEGRDLPPFTRQHRPKKVKEIYKALKREHPDMPAEQKARIAHATYEKMKHKKCPKHAETNKRAEEDLYRQQRERARSAKDQFVSSLLQLSNYFQLVPEYRTRFEECEKAASLIWGPTITKPIFDFVWERLGKPLQKQEKRASDETIVTFSTDPHKEPLKLIERIIKLAYVAIDEYVKLNMLEKQRQPTPNASEKKAGQEQGTLTFFKKKSPSVKLAKLDLESIPTYPSIATDIMDFKPDNKLSTKDVLKTIRTVNNPELEAMRSGIYIKQIINNDPVISEYSDAQIEEAINEITQSIPGILSVPSLLRSTLRKRLAAGVLEPFEIKEISDAISQMIKTKTERVRSLDKEVGLLQNVTP